MRKVSSEITKSTVRNVSVDARETRRIQGKQERIVIEKKINCKINRILHNFPQNIS